MDDQRLATILWRGRYLIAASVAVALGLAIVVTKLSHKVYQAAAIVQVNSSNAPGTNGADPFTLQQASQALAKTYATLIDDKSFLDEIRPDVGGGRFSASELQRRVAAQAITDTSLIQLRVTGDSPSQARRLASDIAQAFVRTVQKGAAEATSRQQAAIQSQITSLSSQIGALTPPKNAADADRLASLKAARTFLTQQLAALVASGIVRGSSVQISGPPTASSSPIRPRPVLNALAGVLLGLLAGLGLAWLRTRLDRGFHSANEAERLLNVPTLASIPVRRPFSQEDAIVGEAFDVLRANLAFLSLERNQRVITFSSYNPREGKTSVVEGLAYAAVRGGMSVLVIDGDVRTQTLSQRLGHADAPGLTSALVGMARLDRALVEIEPGLTLLPAGPAPPNPPSLLSSIGMRDLIAELREQHSLIIIDSPPVANLADASILAAVSDGVVLVARVGVTARADLPAAAANLRHSPTPLIGAVVLEPRTFDETYYPAMARRRRERAPVPS